MQQHDAIERLIALEQRKRADATPGMALRLGAATYDEARIVAALLGANEHLLRSVLLQMVDELADARDAVEREQAQRRGLIGNADAIPAHPAGPYR